VLAATTFAPAVNYAVGNGGRSVVAADLDGDGDQDLAVANGNVSNISVLLNDGNGSYAAAVTYTVGSGPRGVFAADLDGDNDQDLAVANYGSSNVSILKNNGNGTFAAAVNYNPGGGPVGSVFAADLDGDNDKDLAVTVQFSTRISVLKNNGDATFAAAVNYSTQSSPWAIYGADFDGDMDIDLAAVNNGSNNVSVFLNNGNGTFAGAVHYGTGTAPTSVFAADLDGDSDNDLAIANGNSQNVSILKGNGNGTFAAAFNYTVGPGPSSVHAVDLDGDSLLDLAVTLSNSTNVYVLYNNVDDTFSPAVSYGAGTGPASVEAADLNGDTRPDLAVANANSNNVSVLLNGGPAQSGPDSQNQPSLVPEDLELSILPDNCTTVPKVELLLHARNTAQVKIGNKPDLSDGEWRIFDPGEDNTVTIDWILSEGDGQKTVYVVFKGPFFDLTSTVLSTTIQLDQANACHSPEEHAHIVDVEGHIVTPETNPACLSDLDHATVEPYIVDWDGKAQGFRDSHARVIKSSETETRYAFDGNRDGFDDVVVRVERVDRAVSLQVEDTAGLANYDVRYRVDAADVKTLDDQLLWTHSMEGRPEEKTFDLGTYDQLCEADLVPHPHPGDLFRGPSSDIYYLGQDEKRHAFPDEAVLRSWYPMDSEVMLVGSYHLEKIPLGDNVTMRPGSLVRIGGEAVVRVVDFNKRLRSFISNVLIGISYGPAWQALVRELSVAFVTDYMLGPQVISERDAVATPFNNTTTTIEGFVVAERADSDHVDARSMNVLDGRVEFQGTPYHSGDVEIRFRILAKDGHAFTEEDLKVAHDKRIHLIIVRDDLASFQHIHPEEEAGVWSVKANFPEAGHYAVYVDIAPTNEPRVILRASLAVGTDPANRMIFPGVSLDMAAFVNPFRLELLNKELSAGKDQDLTFQLTKDGKPFADIQQYLSAYGHLVIFKQGSPNVYVHTHPVGMPENGKLAFSARFSYAGRYTIFIQINTGETIRIFPITIDVPTVLENP
jgi:hypothetical protein